MHSAGAAAAGTPRLRKWRTWPTPEIGRGCGRGVAWRGLRWRLAKSLQVGGQGSGGQGSADSRCCSRLGCQVHSSLLLIFFGVRDFDHRTQDHMNMKPELCQ